MKFGLFPLNIDACGRPATAARVARLAESAGFDSLWTGDHVVLPDPRVPPSPLDPDVPIVEPLVVLAFLAAHTTTVLLGTGVVILPQRNPLVLAKQAASVDALSGGRLQLGIGVGYLEPEMAALGVPYHQRGARTDEFLAAMRSIWHEEHPAFEGRFVRFAGVQAHPKPARLPIVVGGHTEAAFRRSVQSAHGWYGFSLDLERTAACLEGLREAASHHERPADLGELEISVTPRDTPDADAVARFAELGVHRLIVRPRWGVDEEGMVAFVTQIGEALIARE